MVKKASQQPEPHAAAAPPKPLRVIFVIGTGYLPVSITGGNVSLHAQCKRMLAAGLDPIVVCTPDPPDAPRPPDAQAIPYTVLRLADPAAAMVEMMYHLAPDAIVVRGLTVAVRAAKFQKARDYPLHVHVLRSPIGYALPPRSATPRWRYAGVSRFAARLTEAYVGGPVELVPTFIEPDDYRCSPSGDAVLFINPIQDKGVHIAAAIAERLPQRKFIFVRAWPEHWGHAPVPVSHANIEWAGSALDMRGLYARTKILLVPSVWEEASSRAVTEAQISGIPAVASDRGGLGENVGPGGVVLSIADPIDRWCGAIEDLFTDAAKYARLSALAKQHASRPEMSPDAVLAAFYRFIGAKAAPAPAKGAR